MDSIFTFPGGGNLYTSYNGQGNNTVSFTADPNEGEEDRELMLTFRTYSNSMSTQRKVIQRGAEIGEYIMQFDFSANYGPNLRFQIDGGTNVYPQITVHYKNGDSRFFNLEHDFANIGTINYVSFEKNYLKNLGLEFCLNNGTTISSGNQTLNIFCNVPYLNLIYCFQNQKGRITDLNFECNNTKIYNLAQAFSNTILRNISGLETFNTSLVTNMHSMFYNCTNLTGASFMKDWDLSNVTNMHSMFYNCTNLTDASFMKDWDLSNVTDMHSMFHNCVNLTDASFMKDWNLSNVTNIHQMFHNCTSLTDVVFGDLNSITNVDGAFDSIKISNSFTIGAMPVLETASRMFYDCNCPTIIIGSAGVDSSNMFLNCNYTYNITINDTSRLENASHMFNGCHNIVNLDSSNWTLSNLTNAANMFSNCINLQDFNTSHWNLTNLVDGSYMFYNCDGLTHFEAGDLPHFQNGYEGFTNCDGLNTVTIGNMPNMTNSVNMFRNSEFRHLTIGDMPAVSSTYNMFQDCWNAEDISIGDLSSMNNAAGMFNNCTNLTSVSLGNTDSLYNASRMFYNCYNLTGNIYITCNNIYNTYAMFQYAGRNSTGFNVYAYEGTRTWNHLSYSNTYLNYGNLIPITD